MLAGYQSYLDAVVQAPARRPVVVEPYSYDAVAAIQEAFPRQPHVYLTGQQARIEPLVRDLGLDPSLTTIVDAATTSEAVASAAALVREGSAHYVVKGSLATADLLKGLLGRDRIGLGRVASHLYLIDAPSFPGQAIAFADAGVNIDPDLGAKADIVRNSVEALRLLGVPRPLIAALSAVELVKPGIPSTLDAAILTAMSSRGQFGEAVVDGPLSLDAALSPAAAANKSLSSEVAGQADLLIAPNIDAANMTSKALIGTCGRAMGVVLGCSAPVALPSRGDSRETRTHSLLLASFLSHVQQGE